MLTVDATWENIRKIENIALRYKLNIDPAITNLWQNYPSVPNEIEGFNHILTKEQSNAVRWLEIKDGRGLICDKINTNLFTQALAYAHKNVKIPMLILCTKDELVDKIETICATTGSKYKINYVTSSSKNLKKDNVNHSALPLTEQDIYVITYSWLNKTIESFESLNLKSLVVNDAYVLRTSKTLTAQSIKRLAQGYTLTRVDTISTLVKNNFSAGIPHVILLTNKEIYKEPKNIFTIANLLARDVPEFKYYTAFANAFNVPMWTGLHWNTQYNQSTTAANLPLLKEFLEKYIMLCHN